jgi:hypothetical protein
MPCGTGKPKPKQRGLAIALILIFFLFSIVSSASAYIEWQGYQQGDTASWIGGQDTRGTGFLDQYSILDGGQFSSSNAIQEKTITPADFMRTSLIGNINSNDPDRHYIIKIDASNNIKVYAWNASTNNFDQMAILPTGTNPTYSGATNIYLVKFSDKSYPYIVYNNFTSPSGTTERLNYAHFNGTNMVIDCSSATFPGGLNQVIYGYSGSFNQLIVGYFQGSTSRVQRFDSNCINQTPTTTNPSGYRTTNIAVNEDWKMGYEGIAVTSLYGDGTIQYFLPTYDGFTVMKATLGNPVDVFESRFNGKDTYGSFLFGYDYDCSPSGPHATAGVCTMSNSAKVTAPIISSTNKIFVAGEDTNGLSNCGAYCIWALDNTGATLWNSQDGYFASACGSGGHGVANVTFFQPVLTDLPSASSTGCFNGYCNVESAVCGACQKNGSLTVNVACYDVYTGTRLKNAAISFGYNYYQFEAQYLPTGPHFPTYNALLAANFDKADPYNELMVRDVMLDKNLQVLHDFSFNKQEKVILSIFGRVKKHTDDYGVNPMIILFGNLTNRVYYTSVENNFPQYIPGTFNISPSNNKPLCLNFSMINGLRISYISQDDEWDEQYARHWCDVNTNGAFFYNVTNWTDIGGGPGIDNGIARETFYCYYNKTGSVQVRNDVTDIIHLINLSLKYDQAGPVTYNIIDSVDPYCYSDYTTQYNANPAVPPAAETEAEQLAAHNISANQTIVGGIQQALSNANIFTTMDKMFIAFMILFFVTLVLVIIGVSSHISSGGYYIGVTVLDMVLLIVFTVLGMVPIWFLVLLMIVVAILGAAVWLRVIGNWGSQN